MPTLSRVTYIYTLYVNARLDTYMDDTDALVVGPVESALDVQRSILRALRRIDGDVDIEHMDTETETE